MSKEPRYLMTHKDLAKYVSYVNNGASADSRNMFLQHFKYKPERRPPAGSANTG